MEAILNTFVISCPTFTGIGKRIAFAFLYAFCWMWGTFAEWLLSGIEENDSELGPEFHG